MRRIAIALWEDRVGTTLDFAAKILLVDVLGKKCVARKEMPLADSSPQQTAFTLEHLGVNDVICGAISVLLSESLEMRGIQVTPFVSGGVEEVLQAFENDTLDDQKFLMAGCQPCARSEWRRRRRKE